MHRRPRSENAIDFCQFPVDQAVRKVQLLSLISFFTVLLQVSSRLLFRRPSGFHWRATQGWAGLAVAFGAQGWSIHPLLWTCWVIGSVPTLLCFSINFRYIFLVLNIYLVWFHCEWHTNPIYTRSSLLISAVGGVLDVVEVLSEHNKLRYSRLTLDVNTNAIATYSPVKVVNMTNGYLKYFDTRLCKKPKIHVKPIRMKILANTVAVLRLAAWWVAVLTCWFVFRIAITVMTKNTMLNAMMIAIGKMSENRFAVGIFIQQPLPVPVSPLRKVAAWDWSRVTHTRTKTNGGTHPNAILRNT